MTVSMVASVSIIIISTKNLNLAFRSIDLNNFEASLHDFYPLYVQGLSDFGYVSGAYFFIIALAMFIMFRELFRQINGGHKLSKSL